MGDGLAICGTVSRLIFVASCSDSKMLDLGWMDGWDAKDGVRM